MLLATPLTGTTVEVSKGFRYLFFNLLKFNVGYKEIIFVHEDVDYRMEMPTCFNKTRQYMYNVISCVHRVGNIQN
jgi:hypothetical protein